MLPRYSETYIRQMKEFVRNVLNENKCSTYTNILRKWEERHGLPKTYKYRGLTKQTLFDIYEEERKNILQKNNSI